MLTFSNLHCRRGEKVILDGVSFTIHAKQHVGLVGLSDQLTIGGVEMAEHHLGVDEVLRTAQADDPDALFSAGLAQG